jgi:hypothetical protein
MLAVVAYVVIERVAGSLSAADSVKAITGIAGLAIGHGVHEHVHYLRLRTTTKQPDGGDS